MRVEKRRKILTLILVLIAALIGVRLYLPTLVKNYVNKTLDKIPGYRGHVDDIDLHLWRGAYTIQGLQLLKLSGEVPVPFFSSDRIDFSIAWKPLFRGQLVGDVVLRKPVLNFVAAENAESDQTSIDKSWQDRAQELFPLRISRLDIHDGEVHFRQLQAEPPIDVFIRDIEASLTNLTNSRKVAKSLKAELDLRAAVMETGHLEAHVGMDPYAKKPTFAARLKLEHLSLPSLNDFFKHYLAVEVRTGTLNFYFEGEAEQGEFDGYAKPLFDKLDVIHIKHHASIGEFFKGLAVKFISYTFKNHDKNRLASRVPIQGTIESPEPDIWPAVGSFLKNWFIKAIRPGFDQAK